jgi:hypothetical protein
LAVAEELIRRGETDWARRAVEHVVASQQVDPPWVRPWSLLLRGWLHDLDGQRTQAVDLYNQVFKAPSGRPDFRQAAERGIEAPYAAGPHPSTDRQHSLPETINSK